MRAMILSRVNRQHRDAHMPSGETPKWIPLSRLQGASPAASAAAAAAARPPSRTAPGIRTTLRPADTLPPPPPLSSPPPSPPLRSGRVSSPPVLIGHVSSPQARGAPGARDTRARVPRRLGGRAGPLPAPARRRRQALRLPRLARRCRATPDARGTRLCGAARDDADARGAAGGGGGHAGAGDVWAHGGGVEAASGRALRGRGRARLHPHCLASSPLPSTVLINDF